MLPLTELPAHGVKAWLVRVLIGAPRPEVITEPICASRSDWTSPRRMPAFAAACPLFWLNQNSFGVAARVTLYSLARFSRERSALMIVPMCTPWERSRLAVVVSFATTLKTILDGSTAVVPPPDPQWYPFRTWKV